MQVSQTMCFSPLDIRDRKPIHSLFVPRSRFRKLVCVSKGSPSKRRCCQKSSFMLFFLCPVPPAGLSYLCVLLCLFSCYFIFFVSLICCGSSFVNKRPRLLDTCPAWHRLLPLKPCLLNSSTNLHETVSQYPAAEKKM